MPAQAISFANELDRYTRQLNPDERQWAKDNASKFAQFYQDQTGTGVWSGQAGANLFSPNNLPVIGSGLGGAIGSETGTTVINNIKSKLIK